MPPAILTPADLVAFARHLSKAADSVARRRRKATRLIAESRNVWKDAKYDRFRKTFDQTAKDLDKFVRLADDYSQFLERKAALARKFLDRG